MANVDINAVLQNLSRSFADKAAALEIDLAIARAERDAVSAELEAARAAEADRDQA